jgi:hypothetical protein
VRAIHAITPSDVFGWPGMDVPLGWESIFKKTCGSGGVSVSITFAGLMVNITSRKRHEFKQPATARAIPFLGLSQQELDQVIIRHTLRP